jgi:hypothetical protein
MNELAEKAAALQKDPQAEQADASFEKERKSQRVHYRDASVLIVEISFNINFAKIMNGVNVPLPGSDPIWMSNPTPDPISIDLFNRSRNCALLLKGPWKRAPNGGGYEPMFADEKGGTARKIGCDQIQGLAVHFSGNINAIRRCLADVPGGEFEGLIAR